MTYNTTYRAPGCFPGGTIRYSRYHYGRDACCVNGT